MQIVDLKKWLPALALCVAGSVQAADGELYSTNAEQWYTLGSDYAHTRYTPADEITAENFGELEVVWEWDGASFDAVSGRSTPSLIDGILYTVAGNKRFVVAIDPKTGDTIWTYREPVTPRAEYSMRADYGKGVAYSEVDGRGVIYIVSPGFFLTALDAKTGHPLEGFGNPVPIEGFPDTGVVDLLADLGHPYDPYEGIPLETGYITASSPPIVVNDTVVIGNSAEQGYLQARIENVPGDILAYDKTTGDFKWKFNVIPRPGEYGHETWENDAWQWTGDVSSWAPLSADPANNLVYIPTNSATIDYYGGFRPGDNLYGASIIALDTRTGERAWHFQFVKHEIWNFDTPTAPLLLDINVDGQAIPAVAQVTKQAWVYTFNRLTGEPVWPIVDRPVPPSIVPGEVLSPTQPHVTWPEPFDMQGFTEDDIVDFTPELRAEALEVMDDYVMGGLFNPPIHSDNPEGKYAAMNCPGGAGGANITSPPVADPNSGVLYISSHKACFALRLIPGEEADLLFPNPTGTTLAQYANAVRGATARPPRLRSGIPVWKPPYSRIVAIDMNTGEHLWQIPTGETPARIANSPALEGVDIGNTGTGNLVPMVITPNMLVYTDVASDGTPMLYSIDKDSGEIMAEIEVPARSNYGMSSWVHDGHQYIMLQTGSKLTAMALPAAAPQSSGY
ncbi:MAG: PQQ-binding-like beta-propeller repeat protein [Gammaproteobacteria bacterium]|nr:PQQ-binding-like beta-propeller repeat protein [Gammaproteobacteria bacterium]MXY89378.1 PQQ-binding-like beta-propeller repeat protein [Gammaproteobacteria bacterium]MYC60765.1 PQQ-binding-like beta-propeller repeat protein [Gammaproteobacteria bacterium]MYE29938.1 PQQ-binding-like beta-propeller repeat protein [Gammaproteobacteria bacterium]MYG96446.1 PQQ-binding-like beta-propeller repeat protein [Gammaproteobacteria bacterium]